MSEVIESFKKPSTATRNFFEMAAIHLLAIIIFVSAAIGVIIVTVCVLLIGCIGAIAGLLGNFTDGFRKAPDAK